MLFESGYFSAVFGVALADGREVVVKVRPWEDRLVVCSQVQRFLWEKGFPCPAPLVQVERVDEWGVSAEEYVPGGTPLAPGPEAAEPLAGVLAELVRKTPAATDAGSLDPFPGWLNWRGGGTALWPAAADRGENLNDFREPRWLDNVGTRVRQRLEQIRLPHVIGHGDWWSSNVRWTSGRLLAVDDWDSLVTLPEAAIAGAAAALFANGTSTLRETELFLDAYAAARGQPWSGEEAQTAWAAGLWSRLFDARKESTWGSTTLAECLRADVHERARRAGVGET
ncbi:MAG TPA: phosphotransferase [Chloroflexota bacterium]|nr:phosphotransferase [Chloroflexota bacterium]